LHGIKAITSNDCQVTLYFKKLAEKSLDASQITLKFLYSERHSEHQKGKAVVSGSSATPFQCATALLQLAVTKIGACISTTKNMKAAHLLNTISTFFKNKEFCNCTQGHIWILS